MENGKDYEMPSGAKLYVSSTEFGKVKALHDALARALNGTGISPSEAAAVIKAMQLHAAKMAATETAEDPRAEGERLLVLATLARKLLELGSHRELEQAIFSCAEAAIYKADGTAKTSVRFDTKVVGYGLFDNPQYRLQARGDYYDICTAVVEENLRPFGLALYSALLAHAGKSAGIPKSNMAQGSASST